MPLPYEATDLGLEIPSYYGGEEDHRVMARNLRKIDAMLQAAGVSGSGSVEAAVGGVRTYASAAVSRAVTSGVNASFFGIRPDVGEPITAKLNEAMNWCRVNNRVLLLPAGEYQYDDKIEYAGGGIVAVGGRARIVCVRDGTNNADLKNSGWARRTAWDFGHPGASPTRLNDVVMYGVDFYHAKRPDDCFANDAPMLEDSTFVIVTYADRPVFVDCTFTHNYGGGVLLKNVRNGVMLNLRCEDVGKDNFHTTWGSDNVWWMDCISVASMDDAFAAVGYADYTRYAELGSNLPPTRVRHINCHVRGTRMARGFAYVGAHDFVNIGCSFDGVVPDYIPQRVSNDPSGQVQYRGACGLYVASEGSFGTHGSRRGYVRDLLISNTARNYKESDGSRITSYRSVTIANGRGDPQYDVRDLDISVVVRNTENDMVSIDSARNVKLTIDGHNSTDPDGWGKNAVPGAGTAGGVSLFGCHNVTIRGSVTETGGSALYANAGNTGVLDVDLELGRNNKAGVGSTDAINVASGHKYSDVYLTVRSKEPPPFAFAVPYALENVVEFPDLARVLRRFQVIGNPGMAGISGLQAQTIVSAPPSGWTWQNNTRGKVLLRVRQQGTWDGVGMSATKRAAGVRCRIMPPPRSAITATTGTSITVAGDQTGRYPSGTAVSFYDAAGALIATATTSAAPTTSAGSTTIPFAATPVAVTTNSRVAPSPTTTAITVPGNQASAFPASTTVHFYNEVGDLLGTGTTVASAAVYDSATQATTVTLTAAAPAAVVAGCIISPVPTTWSTITQPNVGNITDAKDGYLNVAGDWRPQYPVGSAVYVATAYGAPVGRAIVTSTAKPSWGTQIYVDAIPAGTTAGCVAVPCEAMTSMDAANKRIKLTGDQTAKYTAGASVYAYAVTGERLLNSTVVSSSFAAGETTVTLSSWPSSNPLGWNVPWPSLGAASIGPVVNYVGVVDTRRMYYELAPGDWIQFAWKVGPVSIDAYLLPDA